MTIPTLDPKHVREWTRIRDNFRIGNVPSKKDYTAKSVQALDAVEAHMRALYDALVVALAENEKLK